jgi:hypothetical protein
VSDIIKTWPAWAEPRKVVRIFFRDPGWARYYFSLGRGRPKVQIESEVCQMWITYRGRILGSLKIECLVCNDGSLPKLRSLEDRESPWQFKPDTWVAICIPPMQRLRQRLYMSGFRGWRYFDLEDYKRNPVSMVRT